MINNQQNIHSQQYTPPHSIEAERAVLGGVLTAYDRVFDEVSEVLQVGDFYHQVHRQIYGAILELDVSGMAVDILTVGELLKKSLNGSMKEGDVMPYLASLANESLSLSNAFHYAKIIKNTSMGRKMMSASLGVYDKAREVEFTSEEETINFMQFAESSIFSVSENMQVAEDNVLDIRDVLSATVKKIDELGRLGGGITGQATGFEDFDKILSGLQGGDLIVVAGRPSMGKTTFAMNIAERVAMKSEKKSLVFSLEMPADQLAMRMISSVGGIPLNLVRAGGPFNDAQNKYLSDAVCRIAKAGIDLVDKGATTPAQIRSTCRRVVKKSKEKLGVVVIDYLQLMKGNASQNRNRSKNDEIAEISRDLKLLAKELGVPIILLSQLNRKVEERTDKRPLASDLRDSGAIEQDADVICLIYRDEFYNESSKDKGIAEIIIAKHRNGPTGTVRMSFQGQFSRFGNLTKQDYFENV